MGFLTATYPSPAVLLLKQPTWNRPVNLLKVGDLGYTYDQSSGPTFGRRKRATYTVPAPQLSVSVLRQAIASRHPSKLQIAQWDFDTQCWFESDRLTPSQQDLCIRRGIVVSLHSLVISNTLTKFALPSFPTPSTFPISPVWCANSSSSVPVFTSIWSLCVRCSSCWRPQSFYRSRGNLSERSLSRCLWRGLG